jgi:hypothetical protein
MPPRSGDHRCLPPSNTCSHGGQPCVRPLGWQFGPSG